MLNQVFQVASLTVIFSLLNVGNAQFSKSAGTIGPLAGNGIGGLLYVVGGIAKNSFKK